MGDFNTVACKEKVSSPETYADQRSQDFNDWMNNEALVDLGYTGQKFMWRRGTNTSTFKGARLDRGLCSVDWLELFPTYKITHLPALSSKYTLILLSLDNKKRKKKDTLKGSRFRFQVA